MQKLSDYVAKFSTKQDAATALNQSRQRLGQMLAIGNYHVYKGDLYKYMGKKD